MPCAAVVAPDTYKIELPAAQEKRAVDLYRRSIVITAHDHCLHADDFRDQEAGGITVRTIKLTTDGIYWQDAKRFNIKSEVAGWRERGRNAIKIIEDQVKASRGKISIVRTLEDIRRAKRENKLGVILSFEGGRPLEGKIENLETFYELGLRDLQTFWAVPSPLKTPGNTYTGFGLEVVAELNRLGMVLDISHHNTQAFAEVLEATKQPVIVSHCAAKAISGAENRGGTDHLDDDGIRAIARNGGVLCLHFYQGYIRPRHSTRSSVRELVDHMDYIKKLVGIGHVALGTDFFPEKTEPWVQGADNMRSLVNVVREMVRRGYTDAEIEQVLGGNLMRIYQRVWKQ
jgi:membrane dipeptidase